MNNEIKDFFISNGVENKGNFYIEFKQESKVVLLIYDTNEVRIWVNNSEIVLGIPTITRLKALIYGLTGINL